MPFTTPATPTALTMLTAAWLTTYVRDNIAWIATDSPACRAYNSANLAIANITETAVTLNSERFDNAAVHSTSSNTARMTIPSGAGGKYIIGAHIEFANNATGNTRNLHLRLNGTTAVAAINNTAPNASAVTRLTITTVYPLAAAEYVEATGYQDSGGSLNINVASNYSPEVYLLWFRT